MSIRDTETCLIALLNSGTTRLGPLSESVVAGLANARGIRGSERADEILRRTKIFGSALSQCEAT